MRHDLPEHGQTGGLLGQLNIIQDYIIVLSIRRTIQHNCPDCHILLSLKCTHWTSLHHFKRKNVPLEMYVDGHALSWIAQRTTFFLFHLLHSPLAFTLSKSTPVCICEERLQKYTNSCNINYQTIECDGDYWVGPALLTIAKQNWSISPWMIQIYSARGTNLASYVEPENIALLWAVHGDCPALMPTFLFSSHLHACRLTDLEHSVD